MRARRTPLRRPLIEQPKKKESSLTYGSNPQKASPADGAKNWQTVLIAQSARLGLLASAFSLVTSLYTVAKPFMDTYDNCAPSEDKLNDDSQFMECFTGQMPFENYDALTEFGHDVISGLYTPFIYGFLRVICEQYRSRKILETARLCITNNDTSILREQIPELYLTLDYITFVFATSILATQAATKGNGVACLGYVFGGTLATTIFNKFLYEFSMNQDYTVEMLVQENAADAVRMILSLPRNDGTAPSSNHQPSDDIENGCERTSSDEGLNNLKNLMEQIPKFTVKSYETELWGIVASQLTILSSTLLAQVSNAIEGLPTQSNFEGRDDRHEAKPKPTHNDFLRQWVNFQEARSDFMQMALQPEQKTPCERCFTMTGRFFTGEPLTDIWDADIRLSQYINIGGTNINEALQEKLTAFIVGTEQWKVLSPNSQELSGAGSDNNGAAEQLEANQQEAINNFLNTLEESYGIPQEICIRTLTEREYLKLNQETGQYSIQSAQTEQSSNASHPPEYYCPITMALMLDPVIAQDGYTYERDAITTWVTQNGKSPLTRQNLGNPPTLTTNRALKALIQQIPETERGQETSFRAA